MTSLIVVYNFPHIALCFYKSEFTPVFKCQRDQTLCITVKLA